MKGLVFIELIKMADSALGEATVDRVLDTAPLKSKGVYSAVGYYDCAELVVLVDAFSKESGIARPELERQFGHWVMDSFASGYPEFFRKYDTAFGMLEAIESDIHLEVRKLYPDAELPSFSTIRHSTERLELSYKSERPLASFCYGLIEACFTKYREVASVQMTDRTTGAEGDAVFSIIKCRPGSGVPE
jgi:hypothetical protein